MDIKICTKCGIEKSLDEFKTDKRLSNGKGSICKACASIATQQWQKNHLKEHNEYNKQWSKNHLKQCNARNEKWRKNNPEKYQEIRKKTRAKYGSTIKGKLSQNMSSGMYKALKRNKNGYHWEILVRYTLQDLIKHLEKRFKEGMNWGNYGKWQIDHEIPISVFNFKKSTDIDFRRCWALSNLQPMWAKQNQKKNAKLNKSFQPSLAMGY
ncbi:MAG: hypothetical protein KAX30_04355 [Candidatus Atribacteria bacterium]|nr:hypothetical protein [Candidatus Atribacteria bacterium]